MDVCSSETATMLSAFDNDFSKKEEYTNVMDFLNSLSLAHWTACLTALLLLCSFLNYRGRILKFENKKRNSRSGRLLSVSSVLMMLICCILKQMSSFTTPNHVSGVRILIFLLVMLIFYLSFYLTAMIKTEAVVYEKPIVVDTYRDLLESDRRPVWLTFAQDLRFFKHAAKGSMEQRIIERAEEMGMNESLISSLDECWNRADLVANGQAVLMTSGSNSRDMAALSCGYTRSQRKYLNASTWVTSDPDAREMIGIHVGRRHFVPDSQIELIEKRLRWLFQHSVATYAERQYTNTLTPNEGMLAEMEECNCNHIVYPHLEIDPLPVHHYRFLFLTFISIISMATVVQAIEWCSGTAKSPHLLTKK